MRTTALSQTRLSSETASSDALPVQSTSTERVQPAGRAKKIAQAEWAPALLIFFCDILCWVGLYSFFSFLRHDFFFSSGFEFGVIEMIQLVVIVQAIFVIGGYNPRTEMRGLTYTAEHILAMLTALGISSLILYAAATFDQSMKPSRSAIAASFALFTPISLFYRRIARRRMEATFAGRAFLVIGAGELASNFYLTYRSAPNSQRLEFVDPEQQRVGQSIAGPGSPIVEGNLLNKLADVSNRYSGIILAEGMDRLGPELVERLVRTQFHRTRVYTLESFYEVHWRRVPTYLIDPFWPLQTGFQLSRTSPYHYLKRACDLLASALLLVICLPLMLLIALVIWLTNGRPVIFKQERIGRDDQPFIMFKFRTMKDATGDAEGEIYTRENDPRISPVGRWLRKLRLDELPQLWNVFRGELSLIGPRAEWVECVERYQKKIPFYHFRHLVKPGITGWAQVNYPYGESDEDAVQKLKYDLYYIRHYSLTLDAMIVLKTIHTILFGKGR